MKRTIWRCCILVASIFLPQLSNAQSVRSDYVVSVHELSIPQKARHSFQQGVQLLERKDPAGSLPYFQRAISEFADYYEAYFEMGVAGLRIQRLSEAEQFFRKSIELSGGHYAQPLIALGAILVAQSKYGEAEPVVREGLRLDPTSWSGYYILGWALFGSNRLEESEKNLRQALVYKTDFAEAQLLLTDVHSREKNYSAMLKDLEEYLKLDPAGPKADRARALQANVRRALLDSQSSAALAQPQP